MKVLLIDGATLRAQELPASCVIVMRDDGTPFMAAGELQRNLVTFAHVNDAGFTDTLRMLGCDATVVVDKVPAPS